MGIGAAIIGSAVVGAAGSAIAGNAQSNAIKDSSKNSIAFQQYQFDQSMAATQYQRDAEEAAINQLMSLLGIGGTGSPSYSATGPTQYSAGNRPGARGFGGESRTPVQENGASASGINIPGQDWAIQQAMQAIERSAAAGGGLMSGNTLTAMQDRAQGIASQNYLTHYLQPLMALAGNGAGQQAGQNAMQLGVNVGNTMSQAGTNRANVIGSTAGGILSSINSGIGNYLTYDMLQGMA